MMAIHVTMNKQKAGSMKLIMIDTELAAAHINEGNNAPRGIVAIIIPDNACLLPPIRRRASEIMTGKIFEIPSPQTTTAARERYFCPINNANNPKIPRMLLNRKTSSGLTCRSITAPAILPVKKEAINQPTPGKRVCMIFIPNISEK